MTIAKHKLYPARKKEQKKLQQLLEVHHQDIHRNGRVLRLRELLSDQAEAKPTFPLTNLAFNGVATSLVINELLLLCCHQLRIILGSTKARPTQTNSVPLTERTIRSCAVDLIGIDHFGVVTITATLGSGLSV